MPRVRFVQGTVEDYTVTYEADWLIIPHVGEFVSFTNDAEHVTDWEVTRVSYVADESGILIGAFVWIEHAEARPVRQSFQAMGFDVS